MSEQPKPLSDGERREILQGTPTLASLEVDYDKLQALAVKAVDTIDALRVRTTELESHLKIAESDTPSTLPCPQCGRPTSPNFQHWLIHPKGETEHYGIMHFEMFESGPEYVWCPEKTVLESPAPEPDRRNRRKGEERRSLGEFTKLREGEKPRSSRDRREGKETCGKGPTGKRFRLDSAPQLRWVPEQRGPDRRKPKPSASVEEIAKEATKVIRRECIEYDDPTAASKATFFFRKAQDRITAAITEARAPYEDVCRCRFQPEGPYKVCDYHGAKDAKNTRLREGLEKAAYQPRFIFGLHGKAFPSRRQIQDRDQGICVLCWAEQDSTRGWKDHVNPHHKPDCVLARAALKGAESIGLDNSPLYDPVKLTPIASADKIKAFFEDGPDNGQPDEMKEDG